MINWTEEDIEYICTNILQPVLEVTIKGIAEEQEKSDEITDRILHSISDVIHDIRYEQERDRRFYKELFTRLFRVNGLFHSVSYDELYKGWCEEFDKLNKEKKDD